MRLVSLTDHRFCGDSGSQRFIAGDDVETGKHLRFQFTFWIGDGRAHRHAVSDGIDLGPDRGQLGFEYLPGSASTRTSTVWPRSMNGASVSCTSATSHTVERSPMVNTGVALPAWI